MVVGSGAGRADCAVKAAAAAGGFVTVTAVLASGFCGDLTPFANEMDECFCFDVDVVICVEEAEHLIFVLELGATLVCDAVTVLEAPTARLWAANTSPNDK